MEYVSNKTSGRSLSHSYLRYLTRKQKTDLKRQCNKRRRLLAKKALRAGKEIKPYRMSAEYWD